MGIQHGPAVINPAPAVSVLDPEYGEIDHHLETWLEEEYTTLRHLIARTSKDLVTIGRILTGVKEGLAHPEFLAFIAALGLSPATAYRWMRAADAAIGCSHVENIESTALYALSATSTPEEMRAAFLARADAGHRVTLQEVQATLKQGRSGSHRSAPNLVERLVDGMVAAEEARAGRDWRGRNVRAEHVAREIGRYGEEDRPEVAAAVAAWGEACVTAAAAYPGDGGAS